MNIKSFSLLVLMVISWSSFAQPPAVKRAEIAYKGGLYYEAADLLTKAYDKISPKNRRAIKLKGELAYKAAYSFEKAYDDEKALDWYERAVSYSYEETNPTVFVRIAAIYRKQGRYDKAKEYYNEFLELVPGDQQVKNALTSLNDAEVLKDNRTRYTVKSEFKINDEGMDMAPAISGRRGNTFVYGSTRKAPVGRGKDPITGEPFFNIWEVEKDRTGNWQAPKLFEADSINTEHNEGTMVFDGSFRNLYFTRCKNIDKQSFGCEIWTAKKKGRDWELPKKIILDINDSVSVGHPCPNEDGTVLIFSGDIPGGEGGKDLWWTSYDRRKDAWSKPKNLGPEINSPGDELFPTFALNGDLLYSSDGLGGLGGLDLFRAEKGEGEMEFKKSENLGTPLNSDLNDYNMLEIDERNGLFTSNRKGSSGTKGLPDIWSYNLPPNIFDLKVIVTKVGGSERIDGATVEVKPSTGEAFKGVTNSNGEVFWDKQPNGDRFINESTDYTVKILPKEGFHASDDTEEFSTVGLKYDQNFIVEMGLLPKTPIVLPEVRYRLGSADLMVIADSIDSKDSLNYVFELLEEYPGMVLRLVSHTDSRGGSKSNERLAEARAKSCVEYLVNEKGVNPERLVPEGDGENSPREIYLKDGKYYVKKPDGESETILLTEKYINQFKTTDKIIFEKLHQFNRRTEAEVIRMDYKAQESEEDGANGSD